MDDFILVADQVSRIQPSARMVPACGTQEEQWNSLGTPVCQNQAPLNCTSIGKIRLLAEAVTEENPEQRQVNRKKK